MSYAAHIIDDIFGGARKAAKALTDESRGKSYAPSTVQSWKDSGIIPGQHHHWILDRGRELGLPITEKDFFFRPDESAAEPEAGEHPNSPPGVNGEAA